MSFFWDVIFFKESIIFVVALSLRLLLVGISFYTRDLAIMALDRRADNKKKMFFLYYKKKLRSAILLIFIFFNFFFLFFD